MLNSGHPPAAPSAGRLETGFRATPLLATPVQVEIARTVFRNRAGISISGEAEKSQRDGQDNMALPETPKSFKEAITERARGGVKLTALTMFGAGFASPHGLRLRLLN